jgi:predicted sulfurtransferase
MKAVLHIAGYKFITLYDTEALREVFAQRCGELGLKGTVVLSVEGINIMLAGEEQAITHFKNFLKTMPKFADIEFKQVNADFIPFKRMLVKIKQELVPGLPGVNPAEYTSPTIKPQDLKRWYDEGRDFVIVDTRNTYELEIGTFAKAVDLKLETFREFPEALQKLDPSIKDKPVVMFCTGGIRCEKATPIAEKLGFKEVYQLEGGILNYFKHCGDDHYQGTCYVFDERVAQSAAE